MREPTEFEKLERVINPPNPLFPMPPEPEEPKLEPQEFGHTLTAAGGWCAPSPALYDLCSLPDITVPRGGVPWPTEPPAPVPAPSLRQRFRAWRKDKRERLRSATFAARKAWRCPDGWWEED